MFRKTQHFDIARCDYNQEPTTHEHSDNTYDTHQQLCDMYEQWGNFVEHDPWKGTHDVWQHEDTFHNASTDETNADTSIDEGKHSQSHRVRTYMQHEEQHVECFSTGHGKYERTQQNVNPTRLMIPILNSNTAQIASTTRRRACTPPSMMMTVMSLHLLTEVTATLAMMNA